MPIHDRQLHPLKNLLLAFKKKLVSSVCHDCELTKKNELLFFSLNEWLTWRKYWWQQEGHTHTNISFHHILDFFDPRFFSLAGHTRYRNGLLILLARPNNAHTAQVSLHRDICHMNQAPLASILKFKSVSGTSQARCRCSLAGSVNQSSHSQSGNQSYLFGFGGDLWNFY